MNPTDLANGVKIEINGDIWTVVEFLHVKPGKGGSFVRTKLKSMRTGKVLERTFKGNEKIEEADVDYRKMQYSYKDNDDIVFMDLDSYEQTPIPIEILGVGANFLKEGDEVGITWWKNKPAAAELPPKVELKVVETMAAEKGNTVHQALKPATLETGAIVQVPMFINVGDRIKVDTRDGKYEERV